MDEHVLMTEQGADFYYVTDAMHSVYALADADGYPIDFSWYDAYGRVRFR